MSKTKLTTRMGFLLRKARENASISQEAAAQHLSITKATLSRIETGKISVDADRVAELAGFYGVSIADLLQGKVVSIPSDIDLTRLHAVVKLVHEVIADLNASPSPEKVADVVQQIYLEEYRAKGDGREALEGGIVERHGPLLRVMLRA